MIDELVEAQTRRQTAGGAAMTIRIYAGAVVLLCRGCHSPSAIRVRGSKRPRLTFGTDMAIKPGIAATETRGDLLLKTVVYSQILCFTISKMKPTLALGTKGLPVNGLQCGFPSQTQKGRMQLSNPLQLPVAVRQCISTAMKRSISWCSPALIGS